MRGFLMDKHPLEKLSEHYLDEQNLSKSTLKTYRICFKYYLLYLKEHDILFAKTSDVIRFRESLRSLGHSSYYIYIYICALRGLYRYLRIHQKQLNLTIEYAYDIMMSIKKRENQRKH